jgi:vacuolar protein-sorting-associated protein 4
MNERKIRLQCQQKEMKLQKVVQSMSKEFQQMEKNGNKSTEKKLNDTEKELKEIYDALKAKLQRPGRLMEDSVSFDSIVGLNDVKRALDTGIQVPLQRPELVKSGDIKPYEGILLFGPPGTGKSMMAKALAYEANNCSYIQVDRADLVSKWQGQSEKMVTTLFKIARENKPCIIFVDEIEGLLEDRDGGEGGGNGAKVVTVLLTAMQNLSKDQVFVLGASNYPWKLDKAFLRRFSQIIYVPLPTLGDRVKIFKKNIFQNDTTTMKDITYSDIEQLALLTEQYSGAHIAKVVVAAMAIRYQRVAESKYFKRSIKGKNYWQPCTKEEDGATKMSIKKVPKLVMPPLIMEDLELALSEIKNNIDNAYLRKLRKWGEKNSDMKE